MRTKSRGSLPPVPDLDPTPDRDVEPVATPPSDARKQILDLREKLRQEAGDWAPPHPDTLQTFVLPGWRL